MLVDARQARIRTRFNKFLKDYFIFLSKLHENDTTNQPTRNANEANILIVEYSDIKNFMRKIFNFFDDDFIPTNNTVEITDAEMNLFLWAILSNRIEIAKIFWRLGKVFTK